MKLTDRQFFGTNLFNDIPDFDILLTAKVENGGIPLWPSTQWFSSTFISKIYCGTLGVKMFNIIF